MLLAESWPVGGGSDIRLGWGSGIDRNSFSLRQAPRALTITFQLPMAPSIGASERPIRIEPAIMAPPVSSCCSVSQAPTAMISICSVSRQNLVIAMMTPLRSAAFSCSTSVSSLSLSQRETTLLAMPMASTASALRVVVWARRMLRAALSPAALSGGRVNPSLTRTKAISTRAPTTATAAISGCSIQMTMR